MLEPRRSGDRSALEVPMSQIESMNQRTGGPDKRSAHHALAWLAYIAFVVYGSLVPLDFHPLPLDQAWSTFRHLPMLQLGVESRADWVANGVLYFPAGFLTVTLFGQRRTLLARLLVPFGAMQFCFGLALAVEFTQLFFAPRTVSLNDVIAEFIGSVLGIAAACLWSEWFGKLLAALTGKLGHLANRVVQFYALGYLAFSLFPFDFVLSRAELAAKVNSDNWGWFLAGDSAERGLIILVVKLLAEMLAVMPIGLILGRRNVARRLPVTRHALVYGMLLGLLIEAAQLLIFSGVSQGASLFTRAAGMYVGARLWSHRARLLDLNLHPASKVLALPLAVLYLLALLAVNGWFDHSLQGMQVAGQTLAETRWLPFYYHYYTTEQAALLSLVSVVLMYAPIGVLAWLRRCSPAIAFWGATLAATGIETSKLFLAGLHPDPTNVLIAAVATWAVTWLIQCLQMASTRNRGDTGDATVAEQDAAVARRGMPNIGSTATASDARLALRTWFAVTAIVVLAAWIVIDFPYRPRLLAFALLAYAATLCFNPRLLWAAIPAAIPLLDLAPLSGRFFLDEFDFLIIVSLLVGYAQVPPAPRGSCRDMVGLTVAFLIATTFAIGTLRGLLPLTLPDANAFSNYYSPFNALRLAKGAVWALLLLVLMHRFTAGGADIRGSFARGMVLGLTGTVVVVIWERLVFPGLFNYTDSYRVTGPFSQMHTGGADIETYLTAALPFTVLLTLQSRSPAARLGGVLLLLASSYALAVTYSRVGYAGFAVALIIICLAAFLQRKPTIPAIKREDTSAQRAGLQPVSPAVMASTRNFRWAAPLVLTVVVGAAALPIYSGSFARERLATSAADLSARQSHWADALAMRSPGLLTSLFGMGIGRFPVTHYWGSTEARATSYHVHSEAGNRFLRLGTGQLLYMEQFVDIETGQEYLLHLDTRSARAGGQLTVSLCEKLLLTSGRCVTATTTPQGQDWQQHELRLSSGDIGSETWLARPPVKLSLYNATGSGIDIDNIRLLNAGGEQLIGNGDFAQGMDLWFFTVDQDLPWHVWSLPVAIVFDQGWYGLAAFGVLLTLAIKRTTGQVLRGDLLAGATLAALAGVLVIATVDTVIDTPRFLLLFLLLTCLGWSGTSARQREDG